MKKIQAILLLLLAVGGGSLMAQSVSKTVLASNGGETITTPYTYTWTIGESVIANTSVPSYIITQGFHPISATTTGVAEIESNVQLSVFPNPASDVLNVKIANPSGGSLALQVYDVSGKMCLPAKYLTDGVSQSTELNFSSLPSGTFYISILNGTKKQNTVTVIKQ